MSRFVEREAGRFQKDKDRAKAGLAKTLVAALKAWRDAYGEIPLLPQPKEKPQRKTKETPLRITLEAVVATCAFRYIGFGFHTVVYPDLSEEEATEKYLGDFTVPKDARMPKEYKGRFDVINAVDPRVPPKEKDKRGKINEWINTGNIEDQTFIPEKPYIVFTHDGKLYLPDSVTQAEAKFAEDEVGEPLTETIDLFFNHPEFFKTRGRDSAGSRTGNGSVPFLNTFRGGPAVFAISPGSPVRDFGAGSRGKVIIELGS